MIVGIDLGTTHSLVAAWHEGEARLIPNALGDTLTPSVVGISDGGEVIVGQGARDRLVSHPELTVGAFKRFMGTEKEFRLGERSFRAEELAALVLRSLREDARAFFGEDVSEAVISVPAYFNNTQREATRLAGELAGFRVERLINEPTAAALAYGIHETREEAHVLVFDLGGGTFDVSILEHFDGVMEVHASAGDNFLGGEDFVTALVELAMQEMNITADSLSPGQLAQLRASAELAKRALNREETATLGFNAGEEPVRCDVTRTAYEEAVQPLLEKLRRPVERSLRDAGLRIDSLDDVVLVGGSTRKHIVQKLVTQLFGRLPLRHINPDEVVALGAAVQAGLKVRDAALREVVLTDVCPYTLGVEISRNLPDGRIVHGIFNPMIERNTTIPVSRSETYFPFSEGQRLLDLRVYQGESRSTTDNLFLGSLQVHLPDLPLTKAGVDVRFTYDINGILEVLSTVQHTGVKNQLVIQQTPGALTPDEIAQRLAKLEALKIHPRDQAKNQAVLARAERLYQELLGDIREIIGLKIDEFLALLDRQDQREIDKACAEFKDFLDKLEALV